jgi:dTDP-4-amino-4,6-dideoxygalactose transaminase
MDSVMAIAERHGLWVIEDCAQAHLATLNGQMVGTFGAAATFSFYPGKNLGAMGDAGAVVTNDARLADHMAKFARHGGLRKGDHEIEGINSRLDGLQAAILNVKLPHLPAWTRKRQALAAAYHERLAAATEFSLPSQAKGASHVWHVYAIQHEDRDGLAARLRDADIQTSVNYPRALPFLPCYARLQHRPEDFPAAHALARRGLALPLFAEMTAAQQQHVCAALVALAE